MTIKELADLAGVSTATVSRALNNSPGISEKTRKRILDIAEKMDYQPNVIAKGFSKQKSYTIGIAIHDISNNFYSEVLKGAEEVANTHNYTVVFFNTEYNPEKERKVLEFLKSGRIDGLLGYMSNRVLDECIDIARRKKPFILMGHFFDEVDCPQVGCNNISSAYEITEYLIKRGHKKIAHVAGSRDTKTGMQRLLGYQRAMENYNLPIDDNWIIETDYTNEGAYPKVLDFLKKNQDITAIFAANDALAAACYHAIYDLNLSIPEDISVVGHDDIEAASLLHPQLTTMQQQKRKIGRIAANKLFSIINNHEMKKDIVIVPTSLIERNSVSTI